MNIITVKDLCLWYGSMQALKNISMDIPEKNITALIGPSDAGNPPLSKPDRMNDLVPASESPAPSNTGIRTFLLPADVTGLRKDIGMVFQKPTRFP